MNNEFDNLPLEKQALHIIHEGFHQIPNVTDFVLLAAGAQAGNMRTPKARNGLDASNEFNDILFSQCGVQR